MISKQLKKGMPADSIAKIIAQVLNVIYNKEAV